MDKLKQDFSYTKASQQKERSKEKQKEAKRKTEDSSCSLISHFWSTSRSPFSTCYIPFQSSGSQENPTLQTVYDLELKRGRYDLRKKTVPGLCETRTPPQLCERCAKLAHHSHTISHTPCVVRIFPCFCRLHFRSFLLDIFV